jgi:hypothetical protein
MTCASCGDVVTEMMEDVADIMEKSGDEATDDTFDEGQVNQRDTDDR